MTKLIGLMTITILISLNAAASGLIHPLNFKDTDQERSQVIAQIKASIKKKYGSAGVGGQSTLRYMEKKELEAFKILTTVNNREMLDSVIQEYCASGDCQYTVISYMYNREIKALNKDLNW